MLRVNAIFVYLIAATDILYLMQPRLNVQYGGMETGYLINCHVTIIICIINNKCKQRRFAVDSLQWLHDLFEHHNYIFVGAYTITVGWKNNWNGWSPVAVKTIGELIN